ncbi:MULTISPECIES: serine hydrolase domain-containing protein [unclassified Rathayibacter]|uniref:serine hydrolase domain-containing protein n=1 Tax=unclassified Rathayibacter TaxID=2609250 RepID=UPI00188A56E3|nr:MULTISPECIES: serine hydrolase [unclassified Rathayibacter]MBF4462916.1 serine hydrolase [Rathayibacter sp. VKM Ac-2879]MBF4504330.1 serine hydrolase [Rathayibacter sp. VKM Ac-2878]
MTRSLPRSSPSAHSYDADGVLAFVEAVEAAPRLELHGLVVVHGGEVLAEGWWAPYTADRLHLLYSVSKSVTSTAVGLAVGEGLVDLDATVLSFFPELDAEVTDPRSRSIRVRHVLAMASGHTAETVDLAEELDPVDLVRGFLLLPPQEEPGSVFAYNQPCTFVAGAIVQRVSGQSLTEYLRPRLLDPLGIGEVAWLRDASGRELGYSGLHATTEAAAVLGQLYLQEGRWGDRQLLPAGWVAEASHAHVPTQEEGGPDWQRGYGFQFWVSQHGFRADGAYGQFSLIVPEHDLVVALTGQTNDAQTLLSLVWEHLVPAVGRGSTAEADARLAERLAALALPALSGAEPVLGEYAPVDGSEVRSLTGVEVSGGDGGWTLTLEEGGGRLVVAVGSEGWTVGGAVAASGGAASADATAVDIAFLETPHRLHLVLAPADGSFTARWETAPLHDGPLGAVRAPR